MSIIYPPGHVLTVQTTKFKVVMELKKKGLRLIILKFNRGNVEIPGHICVEVGLIPGHKTALKPLALLCGGSTILLERKEVYRVRDGLR